MGFLSKKVINEKYAGNQLKRKLNEISAIESEFMNQSESHEDADVVSERQRRDVEDLKSKYVASDICEIKEKLKSTLPFRSKILENKDLDLKEYFPYFFTNPELVKVLLNK